MSKKELIISGLLLAFFGGFFDIYCLIYRGGKFAFLQTGNLLYLAFDLINGDMQSVNIMLISFSSFIVGLVIAYLVTFFNKDKSKYTKIILLTLIFLLITPNYFFKEIINLNYNVITIVSLGMIGGILLESFREYYVNFTSTMMTNNTKMLVHSLLDGVFYKENKELRKSAIYLGVIISFVLGVISYSLIYKFANYQFLAPLIGQLIILILLILEIKTLRCQNEK